MQGSDFLFGFVVMSIIMIVRFLFKYAKETTKEMSKVSSSEYVDSRGFIKDTCIDDFLKMRDLHIHLCEHFIDMAKNNATDEDICLVLEEMESISNENAYSNIDNILLPAMIDMKKGVDLFNHFQLKIQECENNGNIPKGYAYMAWSITLIAHLNISLKSYGPMLWNELKRGYEIYHKKTKKEWKQIPRF